MTSSITQSSTSFAGFTNYETFKVQYDFYELCGDDERDYSEWTPEDFYEDVNEMYSCSNGYDDFKHIIECFLDRVNWEEIEEYVKDKSEECGKERFFDAMEEIMG